MMFMKVQFLDIIVFFVVSVGTILFGVSFARKNRNVSDYTSGGGNMPSIVVGMSIFATFVSSISFLALPGNIILLEWVCF